MRLSQHPLHPAIVHFPIACWVLVSCCDITYIWVGNESWLQRAQLLLVTGLISAIAAMALGFVDLNRAKKRIQHLPLAIEQHITLVSCAWCAYFISWVCRQQSNGELVSAWFIAATGSAIAGCLLLLAGAWFGAELVYKYGIGNSTMDTNTD